MENAVAPQFKFQKAIEELNPEIEKIENEDEVMGRLAEYNEWVVLKDKIQKRILALEEMTKVTKLTVMDDIEAYGFKCMLKDLVIEELQGIIDDVEEPAKFLKTKENESGEKTQ